MKVYGVFNIKGRGIVVALVAKGFERGEHERLEVGSTVRRISDGATWTVSGFEMGSVRAGGYLLSGNATPLEGDELEMVDER